MIDNMLQFTHLERLFGYLPGMSQAPAIFGLDPASYAEVFPGFAARARQAARQPLDDDVFAARVDALPFHPQRSVLAVGDSVTDDLQSWAEILRHLPETICRGRMGCTPRSRGRRRSPRRSSSASRTGKDPPAQPLNKQVSLRNHPAPP